MTATQTPERLELEEIQGLVLHGYGKRPCARFGLFQVVDPVRARSFLARLAKCVQLSEFLASGEDEAPFLGDTCINIAFTYAGFAALGLSPKTLFGFSSSFREGMCSPPRANQLGDDGPSHPDHWRWGGPKNPEVHGILLVYSGVGEGDDDEHETCKRVIERELCEEHGVSLLALLDSEPMLDKYERKEHFGFRDGISNPRPSSLAKPEHHDVIPDGELVLGYRNAYETYGQSPEVDSADDPKGLLPASRNGVHARDFGKNGSYLVFRTLEQDVAAFWRYVDAATRQIPERPDPIWLASRLVGRWPNGTPLTLHPHEEGPRNEGDANAFLFSEHEDAFGERCPIGSHARRTNPRDTMLPVPHDTLLSHDASDLDAREARISNTNRRRIMRRGRAYGAPLHERLDPAKMREGDGRERGLHFLCFNASLRRQFEFVQSMWVVSPTFAGLSRDPDPLLAARRSYPFEAHDFTVQGCPARRVTELPRVVETRGGAYFFMPSRSALLFLGTLKAPAVVHTPHDAEQDVGQALADLHREDVERDFEAQLSPKHARRGAHAKSHGIVRATLEVDQDLPRPFCAGVFQPGAVYPAWVRFSSASFMVKPDTAPDLRGLAIKLMGVPQGPRAAELERRTQDFVLVDAPRLFVPDAKRALAFVSAWMAGTAKLIKHLATHLDELRALLSLLSKPAHPLERPYSSIVPFAHGPGRAVRYVVRLAHGQEIVHVPRGDDHLRRALAAQLARGPVKLELCIEVRGSHDLPLNDATRDWKLREERVALLTLHPDGFGSAEQEALGERMSFNPWNALDAHRPIGSINEARRLVYRAVYELRSRLNHSDPFEPEAR